MDEFGLSGWTLEFRPFWKDVARCVKYVRGGSIQMSRRHTLANTPDEVEDTLRHEIAHALVGPELGHGPEWLRMCLVTGASPCPYRVSRIPLRRG
jgi:predicted SprT family Zn-dependent metalloprotease